eukprot:769556-Pyramimonas_sp.AAC.1
MRSAIIAFPRWPSLWQSFMSAAERNRPVVALAQKKCSPELWESRSFVEELREASAGFPNLISWSVAGRAALRQESCYLARLSTALTRLICSEIWDVFWPLPSFPCPRLDLHSSAFLLGS